MPGGLGVLPRKKNYLVISCILVQFWGWPLQFFQPVYVNWTNIQYYKFIFSMQKCIFNVSMLLLNNKHNKFVKKKKTATWVILFLFFSAKGSHTSPFNEGTKVPSPSLVVRSRGQPVGLWLSTWPGPPFVTMRNAVWVGFDMSCQPQLKQAL